MWAAVAKDNHVAWLVCQLRPQWMRVLGSVALGGFGAMLSTLDPLLMRRLLDDQLPHHNFAGSLALVFAIAACLLGNILALLCSLSLTFDVEQETAQGLRVSALERLNRLSADFHENTPAGDNMTRLGADVDQIAQLSAEIVPSSIRAILFLVANLAVMIFLNPTMTLAIVPTLALFSWFQTRFSSTMRKRADTAQHETGRANSVLYEYVSAVPQLQLLCAEDIAVTNALSVWSRMVRARRTQRRAEIQYSGTVNAAFILATFLVLALGSYEYLRGLLTVGALVAFYAYQTRVFQPVSMATDLYSRLERVGASIRRVRTLLETQSSVPDCGTLSVVPNQLRKGIVLHNVRYSYRDDSIVLNNVSFRISSGESLAIVGPSGSGKSTTARLLVRLSDPQTGSVFLDGRPLPDYSLAALRKIICYVPQRPVLFSGSVRENLLYANPRASNAELHRAAAVANLTPVLQALPAGIETSLGPQGHSLSVGEMQRLALARAILRRAQVLVLDESTSALDVPTEQSILQALAVECQNSILVIITHRLASISWMRRIVVLDQGQVVAAGDHASLQTQSTLYRKLYNAHPAPLVT